MAGTAVATNNKDLVTYEALSLFKAKLIRTYLGADSGYYNPSAAYSVGDMAYYENKLYVCKTACNNILPTNTSYWELLIDPGTIPEEAVLRDVFEAMFVTSDNLGLIVEGEGNAPISEEFVLANNEIVELSNNEIFYTRS